jgi:hypothetical protein
MNSPLVFFLFATLPSSIIAGFLIIYFSLKGAKRREDRRYDRMLIASVFIIPGSGLCAAAVAFLSKLVPYKLDEYVFQFDIAFGAPSVVLGQLFAPHLWLQTAFAAIYNLLPCTWLLVYAVNLWRASEEEAKCVVRTYVLFLILAIPIYLVFPVCGPSYAFPGFPFEIPTHIAPHLLRLNAPPNGVPSIHVATALVSVYFLRRWKMWFLLSSIFLVLTAVATLESGEHYLFDLIVAVPFTAVVVFLAQDRRRGEVVLAGSAGENAVGLARN